MTSKILITGGRVLDPASNFDKKADVALAGQSVAAIDSVVSDFTPDQVIDATGCWVVPGLVDLAVRLREPGSEHARMLESEMAAAMAGGVTSLVCLPDTDPVLDEPGLVEMLRFRAEKLQQARVYPLGALTRGLGGEQLSEMALLTQAGCVGFTQAEHPVHDTQVLLRALQYASTFGYTTWLRPQDAYLGRGVVASGALATRMGLAGIPVMAETIALHTIFELVRATGARVHLCRLSSAAGVELVRRAKAEGLPITADVSIHSLHLTDVDLGYFDSRAHLRPPLRQQADRSALRAALADGTLDALVSDHTPVAQDAKVLPLANSEPGATGLELLLRLAHKWHLDDQVPLLRALAVVTQGPAQVLAAALGSRQGRTGQLRVGGLADVCIFDPQKPWRATPDALVSQGKHTPFSDYELMGSIRATVVGGRVAYRASAAS
ncbi:MAG: dihydroorotase [Rhodoferax sp.]